MPEPFLDRISEATVDPSTLDIAALQAAAASTSTGLDPESALSLVRIANGRRVEPEQDADVRRRINAEHQLLTEGADRQLLAVLAGEALINLFARITAGVGVIPALAMRCAAHAGWDPIHPDVASHAEAYLNQRSIFVRRRTPIGSRLVHAAPKSEADSLARAEEEHEALRSFVQSDRERAWERDQLAWWLLSETRPATALALAREFNGCLIFLPEPISAEQMLAAKLRRPQSDALPEIPLQVAEPIADLCNDILPQAAADTFSDPEDETALVHRLLDQILLSRAYQAAKK